MKRLIDYLLRQIYRNRDREKIARRLNEVVAQRKRCIVIPIRTACPPQVAA